MATDIDINPIPYLTWNWLKLNKDSATYDVALAEDTGTDVQLPDGVSVASGKAVQSRLPEPETAAGTAATRLISAATEGKTYTITKGEAGDDSKPIIIRLAADGAAYQAFHALPGTSADIIIVYGGTTKTPIVPESDAARNASSPAPLSGIITKIYAEEGSRIRLAKVNLTNEATNQIDDTEVVCGDGAKVMLTQIELGGAHVDTAFHATLAGYQSSFESDTAYLVRGEQHLDLNQVVVHKGKKTRCNMNTDGTVKDSAAKTYRGTIDLRKGCSGSEGNEMETTLLLSPDALVKAAPIILCGEEDIKAEHGFTVGKLSSDMLFYLNSRGITQREAEKLLSRAKITAAAAKIPDEAVRSQVTDFLEKILTDR